MHARSYGCSHTEIRIRSALSRREDCNAVMQTHWPPMLGHTRIGIGHLAARCNSSKTHSAISTSIQTSHWVCIFSTRVIKFRRIHVYVALGDVAFAGSFNRAGETNGPAPLSTAVCSSKYISYLYMYSCIYMLHVFQYALQRYCVGRSRSIALHSLYSFVYTPISKPIINGRSDINSVNCKMHWTWGAVSSGGHGCRWNKYPTSMCIRVFRRFLPVLQRERRQVIVG